MVIWGLMEIEMWKFRDLIVEDGKSGFRDWEGKVLTYVTLSPRTTAWVRSRFLGGYGTFPSLPP